MTPHSILRRVAPLALVASAALSCSSSSPTGNNNNSSFNLELVWLGTAPAEVTLASFDAAANTIRETVTGALSRVALPNDFTNLSQCGLSGHPDITRNNITGLRIYLLVEAIDGAGGTLGSAGPCLIRNNNIPALGVMRFDAADVANLQSSGRLTRVVLHEMLHVLGIGTVWYKGLVDTLANPGDVRYVGELARSACASLPGGSTVCSTNVPVHSQDSAGSRYSHWRETTFQTELMTPFLGTGASPFSLISVQALADIGYEVSTSTAEPYSVPTPMAAQLRAMDTEIALPEPMQPRWMLDGAGRLAPYRPRR